MRRLVTAELGAGPLALARAQRAQTARILTETTALPLAEIAFAAGFASIRQFNATIREVFAVTPTDLRQARGRVRRPAGCRRPQRTRGTRARSGSGWPTGPRSTGSGCCGYLGARAIPGVEEVREGRYRRTIMLPNGPGILSLRPAAGYVDCELQLEDLRDLTAAVQRCRRLLDLDADPEAVTGYLSADPVLGPLVRWPARPALARARRRQRAGGAGGARPAGLGGRRPAARRRRLVAAYGKPLSRPDGPLTHVFPDGRRRWPPPTRPRCRCRAAGPWP